MATHLADALANRGYRNIQSIAEGGAGKIYCGKKDGENVRFKISCHSRKASSPRYLIQILVGALKNVDRFIFWFESEDYFYDIPAKWLIHIFDNEGDNVKIRGAQWLVNLTLDTVDFDLPRSENSWNLKKYRCPVNTA